MVGSAARLRLGFCSSSPLGELAGGFNAGAIRAFKEPMPGMFPPASGLIPAPFSRVLLTAKQTAKVLVETNQHA
jgi:hypothetical protein